MLKSELKNLIKESIHEILQENELKIKNVDDLLSKVATLYMIPLSVAHKKIDGGEFFNKTSEYANKLRSQIHGKISSKNQESLAKIIAWVKQIIEYIEKNYKEQTSTAQFTELKDFCNKNF